MKAPPEGAVADRPAAPVKRSFPPVIERGARALVLGTLPGEESLRRREYYAHPRNLFWPIVFALFGGGAPSPVYAERVAFLGANGIALWDVVAAGQRHASADSTIAAEVPNAIHALLDAHPGIRVVAFNGTAARRLYDRHFRRRLELMYLHLPSTSPAHARVGFADKLVRWTALRDAIAEPHQNSSAFDLAQGKP